MLHAGRRLHGASWYMKPMRNVVFVAPFPLDTTMRFARAAAGLDDVRLLGIMQEAPQGDDRNLFVDLVIVRDGLDADQLIEAAQLLHRRYGQIHRVLGILEAIQVQLGEVRRALGVPGTKPETADLFRDKQLMKDRVEAAGLRVPRAVRARTAAEARAAAEQIGYPMIVKPIAGAGSADTYRVDDAAQLEATLAKTQHVSVVSCEEFIDGEEFTFDTVCVDGVPAFANVAQYLPHPLIARTNEWISPIIITVRDLEQPALAGGLALGRGVLDALGMGDGFTHMEWFRKADGDVVFGEIGCRPGGAHLVDQMNYTCDIDLFREWARAVCWGKFEAPTRRKYNVAIIFKRAKGHGRITRIDGLREFMRRYGEHVVEQRLLPPGTPRRNWKQTLVSDGYILLRHPDWETTYQLAYEAATDITMYAE